MCFDTRCGNRRLEQESARSSEFSPAGSARWRLAGILDCDRPAPLHGTSLAAAAAVALAIQFSGAALAQMPGPSVLPGGAKQEVRAPAQVPFDPQQLRASVKEELARLRERREHIRAAGEPPIPPGIGTLEVENARKALALLPHIYEVQLDTLVSLEQRRAARLAAEKTGQAWPGFKDSPPYSVLLSDSVREEVDTQRAAVELMKSARADLEIETETFRTKAQQAQEAVRRASEEVDTAAPGTDARAAASWRLEAARDGARLLAQFVAAGSLVSLEFEEKQGIAQAQLRLAERKLAALAGKVKISKADLDEARRLLAVARAEREKELQSLMAASATQSKERDAALAALEAMRASRNAAATPDGEDRPLQLAEARFRAADVRMSSMGQRIRLITVLTSIYFDMIGEAWEQRYVVLAGGNPDARQQASRRLTETIEYLRAWQNHGRTQLQEVRSAMRGQGERAQSAADPAVEKYARDALEALTQLDLALEEQQAILARRLARFGYWQEEFTAAVKSFSPGDIAAEMLARLKVIARGIWDYELLAIEDQVEVGGKIVTTSRGITVGKSIGAVLLFLFGYRLLKFLSARSERLLVRRFGIAEEQGRTLRRWVNALGVLALALLTLNLARIPLTVFAFAGGALAIGIGFGMQTLIKNLISGMIVLVERNVRVGDIIEVEGVTGRVSAVDFRSSTVRGFDGVESMIPNSMLLEQKVTNWTLTNAHLRRVVKVGVAYGSPGREVARMLLECAGRHGLVLKEPAPQVILEDFGDSALVFALYFWIDLTPTTNAMQVMSDLRFMIEKQLGEAGVVIAFPQRDVHLDASKPLKVEVVPPAAGA